MPDAAIAADLAEPFDCLRTLAAQVTFDLEILVDVAAELRDLLVGQILDLLVRVERELIADLLRGRAADPVDLREPDLEPLLVRDVDAGNTGHRASPASACGGDSCR